MIAAKVAVTDEGGAILKHGAVNRRMLPENIVFSNGHSAPDVDAKIQIGGGRQ